MIKVYLKNDFLEWPSATVIYDLINPKLPKEVDEWLYANILEYKLSSEEVFDPLYFKRRGFAKMLHRSVRWYLEFTNTDDAMFFKLTWL